MSKDAIREDVGYHDVRFRNVND